MTGVEILAMEEVATAYAWNWLTYFITVGIVEFIFIVFALITEKNGFEDVLLGAIVGLFVGTLIGILPAKMTKPSEYETQYKVTISDEVPMNAFLERYEIIDQEGKIYTVRDKND